MLLDTLAYASLFLCWGSFLNVVAHRGITSQSLLLRSACPHCKQQLAWYHLIPLVSWLFLQGRCSFCAHHIPWLYPFIELLTALIFIALVQTVPFHYFFAYFIFFSALIVSIRTDIEHMLLFSFFTLGLVPVGLLASALGYLPITLLESVGGAIIGGSILWLARYLFWLIKKQEGMGLGDIELLAGIGSFVGPVGVVMTLLIGSLSGSLVGLCLLAFQKQTAQLKIPFGAFLAAGAVVYVLWQKQLLALLLL